jgi:hypothetical protein
VADFKKPFKAVPLKKRLKGLEEFDSPLWSPPVRPEKINWAYVGVGLFVGVSSGLAYVIWISQ